MRGYSSERWFLPYRRRYNPAYAGILLWVGSGESAPPIQPRVCGDTTALVFRAVFVLDTTPRMRGYFEDDFPQLLKERYNPAYAGILILLCVLPTPIAIQPRVCGDTNNSTQIKPTTKDTTPRMRGYLKELKYALTERRYNPAYAGILCAAMRRTAGKKIQPRVCGDTCIACKTSRHSRDTTPRMRGY